jgi:hypothetical protein
MTETPLDRAVAAMNAAPEDMAARLRFYDLFAGSELFLLLDEEAEGDRITPAVFPVEAERFALVFDREERLSLFAGAPAPYAALSGRGLAGMLSGQGLGLGVNLSVAPSSTLIPAEAVDWLARTLAAEAEEVEERPVAADPPLGLPEALLTALDTRLAAAEGLARTAYLAQVRYAGGREGHILAFVGAVAGAERALTRTVGEALAFSGLAAGALDVAYLDDADPVAARLARVGLRFDLPAPLAGDARAPGRPAPGSDPAKPPILR